MKLSRFLEEDKLQVLHSLFINYHRHPKTTEYGLPYVPCASSRWPWLCQLRNAPLVARISCPEMTWQFCVLSFWEHHIFLLACHSASWPTLSPDTLSSVPVRHWRSWNEPSGSEDVHCSDHVLPTDGTLIHALATLCTGYHVATFQQNTVNGWVHADPTQVIF